MKNITHLSPLRSNYDLNGINYEYKRDNLDIDALLANLAIKIAR